MSPDVEKRVVSGEKWVFLGATRGMGRALSRLVAERGAALFLLGRDPEELARSAADLEARGAAAPVGWALTDLASLATGDNAIEGLDQALKAMGGLDHVVVTAGAFAARDALEADPAALRRLLHTNFTGTVSFCEAARVRLLEAGGGKLVVFSSVAGDRARRKVYLYGAAKAGLSHYLEGLDHAYRSEGLVTVTVKPGFVRTGMTAGLAEPPFAADPEPVVRRVLRAIDRGRPVVYAPAIWWWILVVIRALPRSVLRRLDF